MWLTNGVDNKKAQTAKNRQEWRNKAVWPYGRLHIHTYMRNISRSMLAEEIKEGPTKKAVHKTPLSLTHYQKVNKMVQTDGQAEGWTNGRTTDGQTEGPMISEARTVMARINSGLKLTLWA